VFQPGVSNSLDLHALSTTDLTLIVGELNDISRSIDSIPRGSASCHSLTVVGVRGARRRNGPHGATRHARRSAANSGDGRAEACSPTPAAVGSSLELDLQHLDRAFEVLDPRTEDILLRDVFDIPDAQLLHLVEEAHDEICVHQKRYVTDPWSDYRMNTLPQFGDLVVGQRLG